MELRIKKELAQAILDYLVRHPWIEVHALVKAMQSLTPIEPDQNQGPFTTEKHEGPKNQFA